MVVFLLFFPTCGFGYQECGNDIKCSFPPHFALLEMEPAEAAQVALFAAGAPRAAGPPDEVAEVAHRRRQAEPAGDA